MRIVQRKLRRVCGKGMRALRIGVTASRTSEDPNVHRVTKNMTKAMAATGEEMITLDWPLNTEEMEKVLPTLDGVIIAGGPDMHPKYYGQEIDPLLRRDQRGARRAGGLCHRLCHGA